MIGTVFLMSAVVPVVPGPGSVPRMMAFLGAGTGSPTVRIPGMITVAMIALGLGAGTLIDRILHSRSPERSPRSESVAAPFVLCAAVEDSPPLSGKKIP